MYFINTFQHKFMYNKLSTKNIFLNIYLTKIKKQKFQHTPVNIVLPKLLSM